MLRLLRSSERALANSGTSYSLPPLCLTRSISISIVISIYNLLACLLVMVADHANHYSLVVVQRKYLCTFVIDAGCLLWTAARL